MVIRGVIPWRGIKVSKKIHEAPDLLGDKAQAGTGSVKRLSEMNRGERKTLGETTPWANGQI